MNTKENIEDRLWDYIDGVSSNEEKSTIEKLLEADQEWRQKYGELLEAHKLMQSAELEQPSMRFAKNVMEEIARYQIAPATKSYINKRIIWGLAAFFITMVVGLLIYGIGQVDWSSSGGTKLPVDMSKVDYSKFFNNTYVSVFMMINVVLGLVLLDRYFTIRKNKIKEA
jgi:hypothetical protein